MGLEIVLFLAAFLLLAGLVYGTLRRHKRDRAAVHAADQITRERNRPDDPHDLHAHAERAPAGDVPHRIREPVGIEPDFSEDDIQREQFGPRGVPGAPDPARMTPGREKKTPDHIDQGHVS